jgi:hypothetical protein
MQNALSAAGDTIALARFLRGRGATVHADLDLFGQRRDGERGVFASSDIRAGVLLLRLPRRALIAACEQDDTSCCWMPEAARTASPVVRASLFLMRELARGSVSQWAPYLARLPAEYHTLDFWSADELHALRGTSAHAELGTSLGASAARVVWEKSLAPMIAAAPALWPGASLGAFLAAYGAVRTRGFHDAAAGGGGPYMLPAIDMLNHALSGTATSLTVTRGGGGDDGGGEGDGDGEGGDLVFSMVAERDICRGEEVTHSYDALDDTQLLMSYGYVAAPGEGARPRYAMLRARPAPATRSRRRCVP